MPEVRRPDAGGIVEVASRDGAQIAQVAALPWVPEKQLFGAEEMMGLEGDPNNAYAEELPGCCRRLCAGFEPGKVAPARRAPVRRRRHGRRRRADLHDRRPVRGRPAGAADDAAVHRARPRPPSAGASPPPAFPTRYAGSLLQLDFGEREQQKSVAIVDVDAGLPGEGHRGRR